VRKVVVAAVTMAVGAVVVIAAFIWQQVSYSTVVYPSASMKPTVRAGDRLVFRKIGGDAVQRGDVVLFRTDAWGEEVSDGSLLERVVGIGGDTVACCDPQRRITVNGKVITEDYRIRPEMDPDPDRDEAFREFSITLPPGRLWLLGDFRSSSADSRVWTDLPGKGAVPATDIEGIVVSVNGEDLTPVKAFTDAGLSGAPYQDSLRGILYIVLAGGGVVFIGGIVWLIVALWRRDKLEV
jgi:signal peptidase I